ncbi:Bug family tripartite tricarboxylate transporter substrate binding protein [Roseomonas sp. CCTCC AB2023176]|uniref:Bug family tripartite tricarboxylate transporter substrate binding protein n=1 Tax=Roseomonas sp. CCTCC AB2023176 TaxID=3342640 RepID=UPI0035D8B818
MTPAIPRRAALAAALFAGAARAQEADWPRRPVRVVVPNAAGGAADASIRIVSERLSAVLGQSVIVDNRGGGGGTIAGAAVAGAPPDGTTFLVDNFANVVNPLVHRNLGFDYRAFVPVTQVMRMPMAVVAKPDLPVRDLPGLLALARQRPGAVSMGQSGNGTAAHLTLVLLQLRTGVTFNEVPYRGGGEVSRDLAGGTLDSAAISTAAALPLMQSNRVRVLAVTSRERSPLMPEVPTLTEAGVPDAVLEEWFGLSAPRGTPAPIVARMAEAVATALQDPVVRGRYAQLGAEPVGSRPEDYAATVEGSRAVIERIVREGNVQLN